MMLCLEKGQLKNRKNNYNLDRIVETTFDWLAGDTPVAVKVNCLDILFMLKSEYSWIPEELQAHTTFLLRDGSAAMQSRGKKILIKLRKAY